MKYIVYFVLFFILFIGYYMLFSVTGLLFGINYSECIGCVDWFLIYSLFVGWWIVIISLDPFNKYYQIFIK